MPEEGIRKAKSNSASHIPYIYFAKHSEFQLQCKGRHKESILFFLKSNMCICLIVLHIFASLVMLIMNYVGNMI